MIASIKSHAGAWYCPRNLPKQLPGSKARRLDPPSQSERRMSLAKLGRRLAYGRERQIPVTLLKHRSGPFSGE